MTTSSSSNQPVFKSVARLRSRYRNYMRARKTQKQIADFIKGGQIPWSTGYGLYKWDYISTALHTPDLMQCFAEHTKLPSGHGWRLDERVVEYPWALTRLIPGTTRLLDAGSTLNFEPLLNFLTPFNKEITILTLAPEQYAFWTRGISYQFEDLRTIPFRDTWFDEIVCLSTLEHVGMDNRPYGGKQSPNDSISLDDFKIVASELWRVLKPGGRLLLSVPFGKHQIIEWAGSPFMHQFDTTGLEHLIACFADANLTSYFFRYTRQGWEISTQAKCYDMEYFNIHTASGFDADYAAAARAVVCLDIAKPSG